MVARCESFRNNRFRKLYQVSIQIEGILPEEAEHRLNNALTLVDYAINDIPVKQEVAFLPYKASMWDLLKSVWMEENADPAYLNMDYIVMRAEKHKKYFDSYIPK